MILLIVNQQGAVATGGNPKAFSDLNTVLVAHFAALRAANPGKDLTTLATKDFITIHAASVTNLDDLNSATAEYLLSNN